MRITPLRGVSVRQLAARLRQLPELSESCSELLSAWLIAKAAVSHLADTAGVSLPTPSYRRTGVGGSLVLVTSRRHLSALEETTAISLDTLPPGEAAGLLVRLAGRAGLSPAGPPVGEIMQGKVVLG